MKRVLKVLAWLVVSIVVIISVLLLWVNFSSPTVYKVEPVAVTLTEDSLHLATGQKIVENVCAYCHRSADGTLSGYLFSKDEGFGTVYAPNITRHETAGLGRYSDSELATLLRTGIKRNGELAGPFMMFPNLTNEDLEGVIRYLRSDVPSTTPSDQTYQSEYSLIAKALYKLGVFKPIEVLKDLKQTPAATDTLAYGKYLALTRYECFSCHSANFETNDILNPEASPGFMAGGNPIKERNKGMVVSRNITPHPEQGIGTWTFEQFEMACRGGIRPDGRLLSTAMPRLGSLDPDEVQAIWAYLKTVPARETNALAGQK